jgi:hypothetical protein
VLTGLCAVRVCVLLCPATEVDEFLQQTEKYIKDLTHRLVSYKAKEEAQEAALEAIAEVCGWLAWCGVPVCIYARTTVWIAARCLSSFLTICQLLSAASVASKTHLAPKWLERGVHIH